MKIEIANGSLMEGDPTGALQTLAEAEKEDDSLPDLYHSKALALYSKKEIELALVAARKAVEIKPDYSDANNTLGKLLTDAGKYAEAEKALLRATEDKLYRDAFKAWTNLGILKYKTADYPSAETYLNRAVQEAPSKSCVAHQYLGHVQMKQDHLKEAVNEYEQATKRFCAGFAEAHLNLGVAYEKSKQFELARKTFLDVSKRYPNTKLAAQAMDHLRYIP